jgi:3-oxoacyl-[acyl-carrier-protein] synthase II
MGEGGGALILETESHAKARGAKIYGVVLAATNNTDGYHVTSPAPDGHGAVACMSGALKAAGLQPQDIGYVNAHGTSTPMGDTIEISAIHQVFGEHPPLVSSTKGATGHMMGAGGITEVIACLMSVREGVVPPTLHCTDPDCDVDVVPNVARTAPIRYAMSNAFGFGGQNSSVIVGAYCEGDT